jgi:hypothetical protein
MEADVGSFISKEEVFQKISVMDKDNLNKVEGFVMCLISQNEYRYPVSEKRRPLLAIRKQEE